MSKEISIGDFKFQFTGHGHYKVTYESPKTHKRWSAIIDTMPLIDKTKNCENPKKVDLHWLKKRCKSLSEN